MKKVVGIINFSITCILLALCCYEFLSSPIPRITNVFIDDNNNLNVLFDIDEHKLNNDVYCYYSKNKEIPDINDSNWVLSNGKNCSINMNNEPMYIYLKNESNNIIYADEIDNLGVITKLSLNKEKVYIAKNGTYSLYANIESFGNIDNTIKWSSEDEKIATVDESGKVTGISYGETVIHANVGNKDVSCNVLVTKLIVAKPNKFNSKKSYLPCGKYDKKENDLLDTILEDRINDAGYKTRAGAVEAARFLALEFPYKIRYFSENGRLSINGTDAEGRYYHKGLYLDPSRYSEVKKSMMGPKTWGCSLYSRPSLDIEVMDLTVVDLFLGYY